MEESNKKEKLIKIETFPIPFSVNEMKENISISSNGINRPSKKEIIKQAFKLHSQGKLLEAKKYYQNYINNGLIDYKIFSNYGLILKDLGNLEEAEFYTRKAIQIQPDYTNALLNLGQILSDFDRLREAESYTRKAIEINPDLAEGHYNLGIILRTRGKLKAAKISLRKAIILKPNFAIALCNLGVILKDLGNLEEAEFYTRKAIQVQPSYTNAYLNLGQILRDFGKFAEAEVCTRKAIEMKPDYAEAFSNLGNILRDLGKSKEAELSLRKAIDLKPNYADAAWNLYGLSNNIEEAEVYIKQCLKMDKNHLKAKITLSALNLHQGDQSLLNKLINSIHKDNPYIRTLKWVSNLPNLPELLFRREAFFDTIINKSKKDRPFYEFGVWRGDSFKYLINTFKKGYGFDTFEGLPEEWHKTKKGAYSAEGIIPRIEGGIFIKGKFEETLPMFFSESRPKASIINFDADLYSSTICALNYCNSIIDKDSILIFDEFIINTNWEQDEYKALNEFCSNNNLIYEVLAISYFTKQVAVQLIGL